MKKSISSKLVLLFFLQCSLLGESAEYSISNSMNGRISSKDNPSDINPYPLFSKEARSLKYPPGVDTVCYWGNGRFQIVLNYFVDRESIEGVVFDKITAFRFETPMLYCINISSHFSVDTKNCKCNIYNNFSEIPSYEKSGFERLKDKNSKSNIYFDPKTMLPFKGSVLSVAPQQDIAK